MFASLFEPPRDVPVVAFFTRKGAKECKTKEAVTQACADLKIDMEVFDYRLEVEALQILEISRVPAIVLVKGGFGTVIAANDSPVSNIRLQLIAAGVRLPK